ncbi:hypothetical protein B296_00011940 [Ensete ventricosum]|uniref:Uncharacterized protein n=1 Tax=Ensete ventricosum TaxID=4639 RepID=A0A426Z677_ENSVE|nr:hypothetical protein B296_00011940 [Ensete ventricosum]
MDETRCAACRSQPSVGDPGNRAWSIFSRCRPSIQTVRSILGKSCSVDAELAGFERLAVRFVQLRSWPSVRNSRIRAQPISRIGHACICDGRDAGAGRLSIRAVSSEPSRILDLLFPHFLRNPLRSFPVDGKRRKDCCGYCLCM